jgi:hypothetical protein
LDALRAVIKTAFFQCNQVKKPFLLIFQSPQGTGTKTRQRFVTALISKYDITDGRKNRFFG